MTPKKSRLRGWDLSGEIRTEILISIPASDVQNGWMATHLVTKRCDLGSLGVPGPASTPLGPGPAVSVTKLLLIVANCYYLLLISSYLLLFIAQDPFGAQNKLPHLDT